MPTDLAKLGVGVVVILIFLAKLTHEKYKSMRERANMLESISGIFSVALGLIAIVALLFALYGVKGVKLNTPHGHFSTEIMSFNLPVADSQIAKEIPDEPQKQSEENGLGLKKNLPIIGDIPENGGNEVLNLLRNPPPGVKKFIQDITGETSHKK